jgi:high affinity Mn2+ porin
MRQLCIFLLGVFGVVCVHAQANEKPDSSKYSYHFQLTAINQSHTAFPVKYAGTNSLTHESEANKLSLTSTLFLGTPLWKNASLYFNPEITGGQGLSASKGIAGFTNGETFRIGTTAPVLYIARLFFRQNIALPNTEYEMVEDDVNQVKEKLPTSRISIHAGKISLSDYFDRNTYSHDPRGQFLNWSLMSNGGWDYPADTRGYTQALVVELIKPTWAIRVSTAMVPLKANGLQLDGNILKAHSETIELEKKWNLNGRPGTIRLLGFHTLSQAPTYLKTVAQVKLRDSSSVDVFSGQKAWGIYGGLKYGYGINVEQSFSNTVGGFFKASWNDGKTATWAFTEIDNSVSAGIQVLGNAWNRPNDNLGIAHVMNGISKDHQAFLKAGLNGFMIGDGNLNYAPESITELYYKARLTKSFWLSADYQLVFNPAYNNDSGSVNVFAIRGHVEF